MNTKVTSILESLKLIMSDRSTTKSLAISLMSFDYGMIEAADLNTRKLAMVWIYTAVKKYFVTIKKELVEYVKAVKRLDLTGPFRLKGDFLFITKQDVTPNLLKEINLILFANRTINPSRRQVFSYVLTTNIGKPLLLGLDETRLSEVLNTPCIYQSLPDPSNTLTFLDLRSFHSQLVHVGFDFSFKFGIEEVDDDFSSSESEQIIEIDSLKSTLATKRQPYLIKILPVRPISSTRIGTRGLAMPQFDTPTTKILSKIHKPLASIINKPQQTTTYTPIQNDTMSNVEKRAKSLDPKSKISGEDKQTSNLPDGTRRRSFVVVRKNSSSRNGLNSSSTKNSRSKSKDLTLLKGVLKKGAYMCLSQNKMLSEGHLIENYWLSLEELSMKNFLGVKPQQQNDQAIKNQLQVQSQAANKWVPIKTQEVNLTLGNDSQIRHSKGLFQTRKRVS